jgi:hypothetical protein
MSHEPKVTEDAHVTSSDSDSSSSMMMSDQTEIDEDSDQDPYSEDEFQVVSEFTLDTRQLMQLKSAGSMRVMQPIMTQSPALSRQGKKQGLLRHSAMVHC